MRILLVTNNYFPYQAGVTRSVDLLYHVLKKQGHTVRLVTLQFCSSHQETDDIIHIKGLYGKYKNYFLALPLSAVWQLNNVIDDLQPSIIHVHHPFMLGVTALQCAQKRRIPVVFTYHTQYDQYHYYVPLPRTITQRFIHHRIQTFCNTVQGVIAPTVSIADHLKQRSITAPVTVIPSAIETCFFIDSSSLAQKSEGPLRLLTVCRLVREKNIPFLLHVLAALPPSVYRYHIAGFGSQAPALQHYAYTTLNLSPTNLSFTINPMREQLHGIYRNADLFIFSSVTETQALVLAEAMAAGLPVIALDAPGTRDIIIDGWNGFLVHSQTEMIEAIRYCYNNKDKIAELQKNALKTAQNYHEDLFYKRMHAYYCSISAKE